jgi:predicted amidohydrolase
VTLNVTIVQHDIVWEDRAATLARLEPLLDRCEDGAELVVLPEMFAVGFSMSPDVAEPPDGPTTEWLVRQAEEHSTYIGGSIPTVLPGADRPSNVFTLVSPGGDVYRYAKQHPFSYANEDQHYAPGDDHVIVEIEGVRVALTVCYDLRFVESYWPIAADVDLYLCVASWPVARREHWKTLLRARAIENQAYVCGVNRVGSGGGLEYGGDSCLIDPLGEVLVSLTDVETFVTATIDSAVVAKVRDELPFMQDRR